MYTLTSCMQIALPAWGCLDQKSSWREFADGSGNDATAAAVAAFQPQAALGVDWHSLGAWQRLQQHHTLASLAAVPYIYLNYRQVPVTRLASVLAEFVAGPTPHERGRACHTTK
jgi:hypothetical protein